MRLATLALAALLLAGCAVPVRTYQAEPQRASDTLVVVLPGLGSDIDTLDDAGIAPAIQAAWPDADVMLAGATVAFHLNGRLTRHLHEDVMVPARAQGYRTIWLVGASMGGRGALLYEHDYPGEVDGLVVLAPLLDDRDLAEEIERDGGLQHWHPARPERMNADNFQRELWRMAHEWTPERAQHVWLVCGSSDWLKPSADLLAQKLPASHYLVRPGGHKWVVWTPATHEIFARVGATSQLARR